MGAGPLDTWGREAGRHAGATPARRAETREWTAHARHEPARRAEAHGCP